MEKQEVFRENSKEKIIIKKNSYEKEAWNYSQYIAGIDEAGRGCLAGPVVAAAVILHPQKTIKNSILQDSKLLSPEQLATSYAWIKKNAWYGIGYSSPATIDHINIYQATLRAMEQATNNLFSACPHSPSLILIDAMPLKLPLYQGTIIHFTKAESLSASVAAASIIAKVTRDTIMQRLSLSFPLYNLEHHKGYGTSYHQTQLADHKQSIIHRKSFVLKKHRTQPPLQLSLFHE